MGLRNPDKYQHIGLCSLCGGRVSVLKAVLLAPPIPTCEGCGAVREEEQLQVIRMKALTLSDPR